MITIGGLVVAALTLNPRGAYDAGETYSINDLVTSGGSAYVSLANSNTGHTPASSPTYWLAYVAKGDAGASGAAGATGATGATGPAGPAPAGTGIVSVTDGVLDSPTTLAARLAGDAAALRTALGVATSDPAAARRWPATTDTLLLWEMDGTSGDLTNTGSLGAAGDLTPGAGMVRNARSVASTVGGRGVLVDTSSTSKADGAIGCKPTSGAAWTLWAVFVIVTSDAAKRTIVAADAGPTWTAPWVAAMLTLHNGQLKGEFNDGASYVAFSASMGGTNALRFACLSYDGATARLYLDGAGVATSSTPGATAWSGSAPWHIGANGAGSERFGGYVLRAGLEDAVLSADEIAERWHRLRGDWIG